MSENCTFIGAYDGECDDESIRGAAEELAREKGYRGIYVIAQDNNLGACLFYLKCGFRIGGFDTEIYRGTAQEGKSDIIFYLDC